MIMKIAGIAFLTSKIIVPDDDLFNFLIKGFCIQENVEPTRKFNAWSNHGFFKISFLLGLYSTDRTSATNSKIVFIRWGLV